MKKLVAWQEEPVMEAPVEKEEMGVTINIDNGENNFVGELVDEPIETLVRKPSKKELDREEGRRGNERKPSNKVTYHPVTGRSDLLLDGLTLLQVFHIDLESHVAVIVPLVY